MLENGIIKTINGKDSTGDITYKKKIDFIRFIIFILYVLFSI